MNALLLILVPLMGAAIAALWPNNRTRPWLLPVFGLAHVVLAFWLFINPPVVAPDAWLGFDPLARAVLPAVSLLFLVCAAYGVSYLRIRSERPNRVFVALLLAILGLLSAGHQARHLGLLWIATEAVTLAAVPLLHFNGTPRAFEATWKYLLVGGTGIALSLLGSFCLGYASLHGGLLEHGREWHLKTVSQAALDHCALENWFYDVRHEAAALLTPLELGLQWRVSPKKRDFVGAGALLARKGKGIAERVTCVLSEGPLAKGDEVLHEGARVGRVLHSVRSPFLGKWVGMAVLQVQLAVPGVGGLKINGHLARTAAPPVVTNRSLYVSPQRHSWAERATLTLPSLTPAT